MVRAPHLGRDTNGREGIQIVPLVTRTGSPGFPRCSRTALPRTSGRPSNSGLQTTFTYNIELRLERPAWIDRTVASSTVTNTVEDDNLTRTLYGDAHD